MMEEIWKDVKDYEGLYQVSNLGRVKTLERKAKSMCYGTEFQRTVKEIIHKPCDNGNGYKYVCFRVNAGKIKHKYIHRLVAESFLINDNNYPDINHKDGNKANNKLENLEWCSKSYNNKHAYQNGLNHSLKGEENPQAKLTEEAVVSIRLMYSSGKYTQKKLSQMFDVCEPYISNIVRKIKWKHI